MGIYLHPGKEDYQMAVNSEIFVDKTEMISCLNAVVNTKQRYVCISRPRRFGKTTAADMVCAYYDREAESRDLFEAKKLKTEWKEGREGAWDQYLGQFNVLRLVMTDFLRKDQPVKEILNNLSAELSEELTEAYPDLPYGSKPELAKAMHQIYRKTKLQFVVVIDEWDAIFREYKEDWEGQKRYLDFLRDWLKDKTYVALAYMTGILPIKKYGKHSALNMFREYSMTAPMQYAPFTGFTGEEVRQLCQEYGRDYGSLQKWYDGYKLYDIIPPIHKAAEGEASPALGCPKAYDIYNPESIVEALQTGYIQNYWNKTENFEALAEYIGLNFDGIKEDVTILMDKGRVKVNLGTYQNDMTSFQSKDDIFALLIHLGYLGYDYKTEEVYIPNREILDEFKNSTRNRPFNFSGF